MRWTEGDPTFMQQADCRSRMKDMVYREQDTETETGVAYKEMPVVVLQGTFLD